MKEVLKIASGQWKGLELSTFLTLYSIGADVIDLNGMNFHEFLVPLLYYHG